MALNPSGIMSIGGSTVGASINLELGLSATANSSIGQTNFRTLAEVPSGQISLSDFYGKSSQTLGFNTLANFLLDESHPDGPITLMFTIQSNGTISFVAAPPTTQRQSGPTAWISPITTGIGSGYEMRMYTSLLTRDDNAAASFGPYDSTFNPEYFTVGTFTPWLALDSGITFAVNAGDTGGIITNAVDWRGTVYIRKKEVINRDISRSFQLIAVAYPI